MQILKIVFLFALILQTTIGGKDGDKSAGQSSYNQEEIQPFLLPILCFHSHQALMVVAMQLKSNLNLCKCRIILHHNKFMLILILVWHYHKFKQSECNNHQAVIPNLGKSPSGIRDRGKNIVAERSERSHAVEEQHQLVQVPHNIASQQVYTDLDLSMALPEIHHAAGEQPPPPGRFLFYKIDKNFVIVRPNLGKSPTGIRDRGKNIVPEGSEPSPKTSKPKKRKLMQEAIDEGTEILDYSEETKTYKKHMPTKEQRKYLEDYFAQKEILESGEKEEIAKKIGFTPRQVEVWFQNRRARSKLYTHQQMGEWLDALQQENAYLLGVNHSLFAENQMLRARIHHLENPNVPPQHHIVQHQPQQIVQYHQQPPQLVLPQRLPKPKKGGEGSSAAADSPASRKGKGI